MKQETTGMVAQLDDVQHELNHRRSHMLALEVRYGGLSRRVRRILEEEAKHSNDLFFSKGTMVALTDMEIFRTPNIGAVAMMEIMAWLGRPVPDFVKLPTRRGKTSGNRPDGLKIGAAISFLRGAGYDVVKVSESAKDRPETRTTTLKKT